MNIIFLHIPKTAGQSIHHELQRLYSDKIAPVRINSDLDKYSNNELEKFNVFSGHLDWNRLKFLPNPFTFTILRDPIERICSFYIYLEEKAKRIETSFIWGINVKTLAWFFFCQVIGVVDWSCPFLLIR